MNEKNDSPSRGHDVAGVPRSEVTAALLSRALPLFSGEWGTCAQGVAGCPRSVSPESTFATYEENNPSVVRWSACEVLYFSAYIFIKIEYLLI